MKHSGSQPRSVRSLQRHETSIQVQLGERLGVTRSHVSEWERGNLRPHGELIVEIARTLQVSANQLLGLAPADDTAGIPRNRRSPAARRGFEMRRDPIGSAPYRRLPRAERLVIRKIATTSPRGPPKKSARLIPSASPEEGANLCLSDRY
ncbi:MAG: helix-turn-helix domain-containing protein [Thermoanaerobaculia bacterium]|nr:helix-turn-helix domain-containing protein [Thermoanaerobaculia bacterium]